MRTQTSVSRRKKSSGMKAKKPVKRTVKLSAKRTPGKRMKFTAKMTKAKGSAATSRRSPSKSSSKRSSSGIGIKSAILHPRTTAKKLTRKVSQTLSH